MIHKMTAQQEMHLQEIKDSFARLVDTKYRAGQQEHGGNLWDVSIGDLLSAAIDEAIDQVVYLLTLKMKITVQEDGSSEFQ